MTKKGKILTKSLGERSIRPNGGNGINGSINSTINSSMESTKKSLESKDKVAEYFKNIEKAKNCRVLVVIKSYPDPDSIACSLAFQYIGRLYGIQSSILYFDEISHHENKALVKKLGIEMLRYEADFDFSLYDYLVFSDTQTSDLPVSVSLTKEIPALLLVDHHKNLGNQKALFVDVRENAGATSSIYAEYLMEGPVHLETADSHSIQVATALMHGIRSDTDQFHLAKELDYKAASYLSRFVDRELLMVISQQLTSAKTMDITQTALENKKIKENYLLAGVGFVREEDRDGIAQTADYLLRREGIDTVIVYGIVGESYIDGSLRTRSAILDPDKWLKTIFGFNEKGQPFGGGRKDKGGFQLPLGFFTRCSDTELLWQISQHTIENLLYQKIGVKKEEKNLPTKSS